MPSRPSPRPRRATPKPRPTPQRRRTDRRGPDAERTHEPQFADLLPGIPSEAPPPADFRRPDDWPTVETPRFYRRGWFWLLIVVVVAGAGIGVLVHTVSQGSAPRKHTVVYRVVGNAPADISYYSGGGAQSPASTQLQGQRLPWTRTIVVQGSVAGVGVTATFHDLTHRGTLACSITVDGVRLSKDEAPGRAFVGCDGSGYRGGTPASATAAR